MQRFRTSFLAALFALLFLDRAAAQNITVLSDVRLIDGTGKPPVEHATIFIQNSTIRDIFSGVSAVKTPKNARVLHLSGKTVMPGIINGHGHVGLVQGTTVSPDNYTEANIARQLLQYQRYGVTTTISLGMNQDLLYRIISEQRSGEMNGATVLTADRGIGVPGGVPPVKVGPEQVYRPQTPDEAREAVREMAEREPALIKLWVDTNLGQLPAPNPAIYRAAIEEAHRLHVRVAAHVFYLADAKNLLADGVDILAHSVRDQPLDDAALAQMKKQGVYYIPTLQLEESFFIYATHPPWMDSPFFRQGVDAELAKLLNSAAYKGKTESDKNTPIHQEALRTAMLNAKKALDAGVNVAFGTDSGANPFRIQGFAEHRELQLLVDAGFTPLEAIHSATEVNAQMLAIANHTGTLAKSKDADILVLDGNPTSDIRNTQKLDMVFHLGRLTNR
jgi:imidazolonepropionase-like amidohydrolase